MFKGLEGRSAIVTGGSTLIGAGVVRALHAAGVKVVIADIDAANGQPLADSLGAGVRFVRTDITDDAQVKACVAEAAEHHGGCTSSSTWRARTWTTASSRRAPTGSPRST